MENKLLPLAILSLAFVASSCTGGSNPVESSIFSSSVTTSAVASSSEESSLAESSPKEVGPKKTKLDFMPLQELLTYDGRTAFPSKGEHRCLVLPIEFEGYRYGNEELTKINAVLNGSGPEDTNYWESLSSFYQKSSYGTLSIQYDLAEPYLAKDSFGKALSPEGVYNYYGPGSEGGNDYGLRLIQNAYNQFVDLHGADALKQYDSDHDGFLDGIIAVYACPDFVTGNYTFDQSTYYWAYTFWADIAAGYVPGLDFTKQDVNKPGVSVFFWTSNYFMYDSSYVHCHPGAVDPHTYIHESGHMLGLDDYYPSGSSFSPLGGLDMMDMNILDHDCYSKMVLGWVDPYVVTEEMDITIGSFEETGDFILIPAENWSRSPYDEYILIELYTPTGLNELDSKEHLNWSRPKGYQEPGIRIFHVDSRVMKYTADNVTLLDVEYVSSPEEIGLDQNAYYTIGATNCHKTSSPADSSFSLIHMIESGRKNTFESGYLATDESLFHVGDYFDIRRYASFFPNHGKMNNGENFPYRVFIDALDERSATIGIEKIG